VFRRRGLERVAVVAAALGAALLPVLLAAPGAGAAGGRYTVTSTGDTADATAGDGLCRTTAGTCTLRAALQQDQADGGPSTVAFAIPGSGPRTIQLGSALPALAAGGTTVDGYTQSGSSPNTAARSSNATLRIEVSGSGNGGPEGFVITSAGNTVRGLALFNLRVAVRIAGTGARGNVLAGNFIGTNAAASFQAPSASSSAAGVVIRANAPANRIGGTAVADRNVISGNAGRGIIVNVPAETARGTVENVIQGNIIGLVPDGSARRGNLGHGIDINAGASRNHVLDNVISGNVGSAVEVSHGTTTAANEVAGNRIGTDLSGAGAPTYARNGGTSQPNVRVEDGPVDTLIRGNVIGGSVVGGVRVNAIGTAPRRTRIEDNRIGVSTTGAGIANAPFGVSVESGSADTKITGNEIASNNGPGVRVADTATDRVTISGNAIHDNSGLGIDLLPAGVTPNDTGDGDDGPNDLLNFPVLEPVAPRSVRARACGGCRIEVFLADTADSGANGEGRDLVASGTTDSGGTATLSLPDRALGQWITATATNTAGSTSEFSENIVAPK
jgi:CSLREA domain-containing protein